MKQLVVSIVGGKVNFLFFISIYLFIYLLCILSVYSNRTSKWKCLFLKGSDLGSFKKTCAFSINIMCIFEFSEALYIF